MQGERATAILGNLLFVVLINILTNSGETRSCITTHILFDNWTFQKGI